MKATELLQIVVGILALSHVAAIPPIRSVMAYPDSDSLVQRVTLNPKDGTLIHDNPAVLQQQQHAAHDVPAQTVPKEQATKAEHRQGHMPARKGVSNKTIFISSIAFLTGCVDTVCYRRYKCYVNMMTGNTIRFATALAESRWTDAFFHISLILSYIVGVGIFRVMDLNLLNGDNMAGESSSQKLLTAVAFMIVALFGLADVVSHFFANNRVHAPLLSIGFGIMNAASADATGGTILYAMTGHITKLGRSYVDYWMLSKPKAWKSCKSHLRIVVCFAAGIALSVKASQYILPLTAGFQPPVATTAGALFAALFLWYGGVSKSHSSATPT